MLGWRLLISAILIPLLLLLFRFDASLGDGAPVLLVFCLLLTIRACYELTDLLTVRNIKPSLMVTATCSVCVVFAAWAHTRFPVAAGTTVALLTSLGCILVVLAASALCLMLLEAIQFRAPVHSMESLGANLLIVFYAAGLLGITAQFRWFPSTATGYFAIGSMIIAAKSGDIGGYTLGRLFGKRKMAPNLSPGKTWMGAFGAVVGSCLGGWAWLTFGGALFEARPVAADLQTVMAYCATLGVVGLIGDLCESLIKRDVEKKDSAKLMPGFGGLLDLLDSILFAGPVALIWWMLLPPAT